MGSSPIEAPSKKGQYCKGLNPKVNNISTRTLVQANAQICVPIRQYHLFERHSLSTIHLELNEGVLGYTNIESGLSRLKAYRKDKTIWSSFQQYLDGPRLI